MSPPTTTIKSNYEPTDSQYFLSTFNESSLNLLDEEGERSEYFPRQYAPLPYPNEKREERVISPFTKVVKERGERLGRRRKGGRSREEEEEEREGGEGEGEGEEGSLSPLKGNSIVLTSPVTTPLTTTTSNNRLPPPSILKKNKYQSHQAITTSPPHPDKRDKKQCTNQKDEVEKRSSERNHSEPKPWVLTSTSPSPLDPATRRIRRIIVKKEALTSLKNFLSTTTTEPGSVFFIGRYYHQEFLIERFDRGTLQFPSFDSSVVDCLRAPTYLLEHDVYTKLSDNHKSLNQLWGHEDILDSSETIGRPRFHWKLSHPPHQSIKLVCTIELPQVHLLLSECKLTYPLQFERGDDYSGYLTLSPPDPNHSNFSPSTTPTISNLSPLTKSDHLNVLGVWVTGSDIHHPIIYQRCLAYISRFKSRVYTGEFLLGLINSQSHRWAWYQCKYRCDSEYLETFQEEKSLEEVITSSIVFRPIPRLKKSPSDEKSHQRSSSDYGTPVQVVSPVESMPRDRHRILFDSRYGSPLPSPHRALDPVFGVRSSPRHSVPFTSNYHGNPSTPVNPRPPVDPDYRPTFTPVDHYHLILQQQRTIQAMQAQIDSLQADLLTLKLHLPLSRPSSVVIPSSPPPRPSPLSPLATSPSDHPTRGEATQLLMAQVDAALSDPPSSVNCPCRCHPPQPHRPFRPS